MPRDAIGREKWCDEKQERPRGEHSRLDELPAEDGLCAHRQCHQGGGLAIAEKVAIADHEVAQHQQREQKREEQIQQPFEEQRAQSRKLHRHEMQPLEEQPEGQRQIADHEQRDDYREQAGLMPDAFEPPP
jgi:hypothetical protein